jgi:hypothetical protein
MPLDDVIFPRAGQYAFRIRVKGKTLEGPSLYLMKAPGGAASA